MKNARSLGFLHYGVFVTLLLSGIFTYNLFYGDRQFYLPGATTHGHHQIEMECDACHVESFESGQPMQQACMGCHGEALDKARDTHPKKKFTDPRNADLLANLDATQCITCHIEHSPEITGEFGVTLPEDFCFYCHQNIAEERPSHKEFAFDSCSNSGCHSYHDNRALYEQFLQKQIDKPALLVKRKSLVPNGLLQWKKKHADTPALQAKDHDAADTAYVHQDSATNKIVQDWSGSAHAQANVNCGGCHSDDQQQALSGVALSVESCSDCHARQTDGFKSGLHGMRVGAGLDPMRVSNARLPMHENAGHRELTCASCHDPHKPDLKAAAVDACMGCHNDEHTQNYPDSAHAELYQQALVGDIEDGQGVSCASCHMPRIKKGKTVFVEHNQTLTLEPNSKMLRPVCMNCHGLEFSTAALADKDLIRRNFSGEFDVKHPSFNMVRARLEEKRKKKRERKKQLKD